MIKDMIIGLTTRDFGNEIGFRYWHIYFYLIFLEIKMIEAVRFFLFGFSFMGNFLIFY